MIKAYPPIWCNKDNCLNCDLEQCNSRALMILLPYRDIHTPFHKRGPIEVTSIAVYLGFCPRLAKFFLEFPSLSPIGVVYSNFLNSTTAMPTTQPIQRILLDILASSDPDNLTDDIFKYRGLLLSPAVGKTKYQLSTREGVKTFSFSQENISRTQKKVSRFLDQLLRGIVKFPRTNKKERCAICYIRASCDNEKSINRAATTM